jgi:hypothetical protein
LAFTAAEISNDQSMLLELVVPLVVIETLEVLLVLELTLAILRICS